VTQPRFSAWHGASVAAAAATTPAGTVRIGPLQPALDLLREHGADPAAVLAACGLPADGLDVADQRIPLRTAACLFQQGAWVTGRAEFGLLVGQRFELWRAGVLGELMRHAPSVGTALQLLSRYFHLQDRGSVPYLRRVDDGHVALGYAIHDGAMPGAGLAYDAVLAMAATTLRALCGPSFRLVEVRLAHGRPPRRLPYRQCFGAPVVFDASHSELCFEARWLGVPVAGAEPPALDAARCLARGAEMRDPLAWTERACAAARTLVMRGELSGAQLARALGLHPRTLRRRLGEEGTGVRAIFDAVRCSLARELLQQTQLPLHEIASTLGFAEASAFVRAFRSWAGSTPGRWRAQQRLNAPAAP
jgi:AraC-like DNA-binding protein